MEEIFQFLAEYYCDLIAGFGFLLIVIGLALIYFPLSLILCGLGLMVTGLAGAYLGPWLKK